MESPVELHYKSVLPCMAHILLLRSSGGKDNDEVIGGLVEWLNLVLTSTDIGKRFCKFCKFLQTLAITGLPTLSLPLASSGKQSQDTPLMTL